MQITINNYGGNITINEVPKKNFDPRSTLLSRMYYARNKQTLGGYDAWLQLLDMYYSGEYDKMIEHISSCKGRGNTKSVCLKCLNMIKAGDC